MILVLQAWDDSIGLFIGRIEAAPLVELLHIRDYNPAYRVGGIIPVNQGEIIIAAAKRKFVGDLF